MGHIAHNFRDLTGQRFSRLLVIRRGPDANGKKARWECQCDCGKVVFVITDQLRSGHTRSCGCLATELARARNTATKTTHGQTGQSYYRVWVNMNYRCRNERCKEYRHYGGRGITVCQRWQDSFEAFREDMGPRPSGYSIDRIDVNGNYEPGNCRWADNRTQSNNRRDTTWVEAGGITGPAADVARALGLSYSTLKHRAVRNRKGARLIDAPHTVALRPAG